ncbi:MAG: acetyl-CoA decarbonylase/synthase complex subunit delta [Deltaproteobacteria bacterium]|nr:acetyl-CoA decarbonylase/synthase complex subunit delta [Deltaproteobacteria bacterium]
MAFEVPKIKYSGAIKEVEVGQPGATVTVGGESSYPFHVFEGKMPNKPLLAMEVWDMEPTEWPAACAEPFQGVLGDPAAWAKKCVEEFGAQAIVVQLKSTDPNGDDAPAAQASASVGKVLGAVSVPVIVWGCANANKDAEVLKKIAEDYEGKNLLLGPVDEDNHKSVGAAALAYKHSLISSSPIDVNLAKQLNILLGNLGVPLERLVIDPTTGGLGYGMEYSYSVMERIRAAALVQEDDKLVLPMINNVGNEVWKSKEAVTTEDASLGDNMKRGILMETAAAVAYLLAGTDILILRHPQTLKNIRAFIDKLSAERAPAAAKTAVDRPKVAALAGAKPAAKPAAAPAAKPAAPAAAKPAAAPAAKPAAAAPAAAAPEKAAAEADAKAKAEAAAKVKAEAEAAAKAKASDAAAVKAAEEAKAKAAADAKLKAAADAKAEEAAAEAARRDAVQKQRDEVAELRRQRAAERAKLDAEREAKACAPAAEDVEYGEYRAAGVAGPEASYIERSLARWHLRGDGYLKR